MFMRGASYIGANDLQRQLRGLRSELREPRHARRNAVDFERVAAGRLRRQRHAHVHRFARRDLARRIGQTLPMQIERDQFSGRCREGARRAATPPNGASEASQIAVPRFVTVASTMIGCPSIDRRR